MVDAIARTDSYKLGHFWQYNPDIVQFNAYVEARGIEADRDWDVTVVAGMEWIRKYVLEVPVVTRKSLDRMAKRAKLHGPSFDYDMWDYILQTYNGYLPIDVMALPEGTVAPLKTPLFQVINYDPRINIKAVISYKETEFLRAIWYPTTVATLSYHIKKTLKKYMLETAGHIDGLDFMLHDFGARGVSSSESAQIGGLAHLYNFMGSDTFEAIELAEELYQEEMAGFSIDASEHSVMTTWPSELEAFEHIIDAAIPNKIFAIVSDSYNFWEAIDHILGFKLNAKVQALGEMNSRLVVRPDSGDPIIVVVKAIEKLMDHFGYTKNALGYKVLPPFIRVIQGDGVNEKSIAQILERMKVSGLSAENVVFGMGGALLQGVTRDTLKFAYKVSASVDKSGNISPVFKDPIDDKGKKSKTGIQHVNPETFEVTGHFTNESYEAAGPNLLQPLIPFTQNKPTLTEVRTRINSTL